MNRPLKYQGSSICMQEVPDEIAVAFNIADCPHKCAGCHSKTLWDYDGHLLGQKYQYVINALLYPKGITCVCFMGGEWRPRELITYCRFAHKQGLKTCLYSGADDLKQFDGQLLQHLDYLKIGSWRQDKGPLSDKNTNQRMFKLRDDDGRPAIIDITYKFQKEYL